MLCGRVGVCAVCGAEAARASELATTEIHPSIRERTSARDVFLSTVGKFRLFPPEAQFIVSELQTSFPFLLVLFRKHKQHAGDVFPVVSPVLPACPAVSAAPSRILYAQHADPVLPKKTHLRARAPWPAPVAFSERYGSQAASHKEPKKLPGHRRPESGGGRRRRKRRSRRRRRASNRFGWNGDGGEDPESHRLQGGGPPLLQGEEISGSDRQVPPGAAAAEGGACGRRDDGLRGQSAEPSRCQADRGAAESRGEHRDRVLRQPDRWVAPVQPKPPFRFAINLRPPLLTPAIAPVHRVHISLLDFYCAEAGEPTPMFLWQIYVWLTVLIIGGCAHWPH